MTGLANDQASLEVVLKDEIIRMYQEVADKPGSTFHFFHGREAAELFDYAAEWLDRAPTGEWSGQSVRWPPDKPRPR